MKGCTRSVLAILALACLAGCAKGKTTTGWDVGDGLVDGLDDTTGDVPSDVPLDRTDGGPALPGTPFESETAGGGAISSENYTIELYLAPARPVGSTSDASRTIKLGPAGVRAP